MRLAAGHSPLNVAQARTRLGPARSFLQISRIAGEAGELLWVYRPVASFPRWTIQKQADGSWQLTAVCDRIDAFQIRQTPLLFTAPRGKQRWCWPVVSVRVQGTTIYARLGLPEQ